MVFSETEPGTFTFYTLLPRRFGDLGVTRHGLFANGGWYPQPVVPDGMPLPRWDVSITLPQEAVGALGEQVGQQELSWVGHGERVSLAVLPSGRVTYLRGEDFVTAVLTRRRPRRALLRELEEQLEIALPNGSWVGAIVEAPLRRRLVRPGVGLSYVSDRAYRVTPGFRGIHRVSVTRGVMEGLQSPPDPFVRDLLAAGLSLRHQAALQGRDAEGLLRLGGWIPAIDELLNNGRMPFVSEIFGDIHPGDPVHDDLVEIFMPATPGPVVAAQLDTRFGEGTAEAVALAMIDGSPLTAALQQNGVPASFLLPWRRPYPDQEYRLSVDKTGVTLARETVPSAQPEDVVLLVDGERRTLSMEAGPGVIQILEERPKRVRFDPDGQVAQRSSIVDGWPAPFKVILEGYVSTFNIRQRYIEATGSAWLRRRGDTRNVGFGTLSTTREDRVALTIGYKRRFGPLVDGLRRRNRITWTLGGGWLNQNYAAFEGGKYTLGAGISWGYNARIDRIFPLRGRGHYVGVSGGVVPGTEHTWVSTRLSTTHILGIHPRHALAVRIFGGMARSTVPHRLLDLGGPSRLRSIPPGLALTTDQAAALFEYRWAPLRNLSLPMLLTWGSEIQVTAGVEAGAGRSEDQWFQVIGATAGVAGVGDVFGADPSMIGLTAAWPLVAVGALPSSEDGTIEPTGIPEVYLRFWQEF